MRASCCKHAVLCATLVLWCSTLCAGNSPALIHDAEGVHPAAVGYWHAPAQGWVLAIDVAGVRRYQLTAAGCYHSVPLGENMPLMGQLEYRYFEPAMDRRSAGFLYLPGDQSTQFRRLPTLPQACLQPPPQGESGVFEVFVSVMGEHYAFFRERGIDWSTRVAAARPRVHDGMGERALRKLLGEMLQDLGDSHTKLIGTVEGERFRIQDGQGDTLPRVRATMGEPAWLQALVRQTLETLQDGRHVANERLIWGVLDGRVGYLQLFTMGGFSDQPMHPLDAWAAAELAELDRHLDQAMRRFQGLDAVIVDLSNNRGGYDAVARALAARFSDSPFMAYRMDTDRDGRPDHSYRIEAAQKPRYTGPVVVLTSDVTVSGGEIATLALRSLPNVIHAGGATRGSFSTPLAKPLPNGWYLELSSEIFTAPDGRSYEASGIPPQWPIEVYPAARPVAGHADALSQLLRRLQQQQRGAGG